MQATPTDFNFITSEKYNLNTQIVLDQSTSQESWQEYSCGSAVDSSPLQIKIPMNPTQFTDLANSYLKVSFSVGDAANPMPPANALVSMVNNAFMALIDKYNIKLNNQEIETHSEFIHTYNTMYNLLKYSNKFSTDGS